MVFLGIPSFNNAVLKVNHSWGSKISNCLGELKSLAYWTNEHHGPVRLLECSTMHRRKQVIPRPTPLLVRRDAGKEEVTHEFQLELCLATNIGIRIKGGSDPVSEVRHSCTERRRLHQSATSTLERWNGGNGRQIDGVSMTGTRIDLGPQWESKKWVKHKARTA
jgi:hypothetical protein